MSVQRRILITLVWILSLVAVQAWAQSGARRIPRGAEPEVITGSDIGFQVDHVKGDTPVGSLVVKRDGKWVGVEFGGRIIFAK
jgi:hypothetical protein